VTTIQYGLATVALGIALIIVEYIMAGKKKGGVSATDKKSIIGLFWISLGVAGLVMFTVSNMGWSK
jgi:hypothetical protein